MEVFVGGGNLPKKNEQTQKPQLLVQLEALCLATPGVTWEFWETSQEDRTQTRASLVLSCFLLSVPGSID